MLYEDVRIVRAESERWRNQVEDHLRGLGAAIQEQFEAWHLSKAEQRRRCPAQGVQPQGNRLRYTRTTTIRQQAASIYQKANLSGRTALSAFFLEDLLLPHHCAGGGVGPPRERGLRALQRLMPAAVRPLAPTWARRGRVCPPQRRRENILGEDARPSGRLLDGDGGRATRSRPPSTPAARARQQQVARDPEQRRTQAQRPAEGASSASAPYHASIRAPTPAHGRTPAAASQQAQRNGNTPPAGSSAQKQAGRQPAQARPAQLAPPHAGKVARSQGLWKRLVHDPHHAARRRAILAAAASSATSRPRREPALAGKVAAPQEHRLALREAEAELVAGELPAPGTCEEPLELARTVLHVDRDGRRTDHGAALGPTVEQPVEIVGRDQDVAVGQHDPVGRRRPTPSSGWRAWGSRRRLRRPRAAGQELRGDHGSASARAAPPGRRRRRRRRSPRSSDGRSGTTTRASPRCGIPARIPGATETPGGGCGRAGACPCRPGAAPARRSRNGWSAAVARPSVAPAVNGSMALALLGS